MLQKLGFLPGFNKQVTSTGAESQWTGGENVRVGHVRRDERRRVSRRGRAAPVSYTHLTLPTKA